MTGFSVVDLSENLDETIPMESYRRTVVVLPSSLVEDDKSGFLHSWRESGGRLVFVKITWEESWKAVTNSEGPGVSGIPWRLAYRQLARKRTAMLRQEADFEISATGCLSQIAARIVDVLTASD